MRYRPTLLLAEYQDPVDRDKSINLVSALGFPRVLLYPESRSAAYSSSAARRQKVIGMTAEMAGGGNVDRLAMGLLRDALPRYLHACGVYDASDGLNSRGGSEYFRLPPADGYLFARHEGVFEPTADVDEEVKANQVAGWIHSPEVPFSEPVELRFKVDARVLSMRVPARVERGDCLYELGVRVSVGDPPG